MARKQASISPNRTARALKQRLEDLQAAGVTHIGRAPSGGCGPEAASARAGPAGGSAASAADPGGRAAALAAIAREVATCRRCAELTENRTQTVFGAGNPCASLVFCGEGPGAEEDRRGEPFVGAAGQLLDRILQACGFRREEVYILNAIKCRPPSNRTPEAEEVANCRPFLERQLAVLRPAYVCCLGAVGAKAVLQSGEPLGRLRGRVHQVGQIQVVCTYHPAYLLRTPSAKRATWEDMKLLLRAMGRNPPRE